MSSFSFTEFCRKPRKHNYIILGSAKFTSRIQDLTLEFSIPFFIGSNNASRE